MLHTEWGMFVEYEQVCQEQEVCFVGHHHYSVDSHCCHDILHFLLDKARELTFFIICRFSDCFVEFRLMCGR